MLLRINRIYRDNISYQIVCEKNPCLLTYIEGELEMLHNNKTVFCYDRVCLLELGVQLSLWMKNFGTFSYNSMTCEEDGILKFEMLTNDIYVISSIWKSDLKNTCTIEQLKHMVSKYLCDLNCLLHEYDMTVDDFVKFD